MSQIRPSPSSAARRSSNSAAYVAPCSCCAGPKTAPTKLCAIITWSLTARLYMTLRSEKTCRILIESPAGRHSVLSFFGTWGQGLMADAAIIPISRVKDSGGTFHLVLIRPTHYDDEGYPIQWITSVMPSNSLACINALAEDAARREVLGPGVEFRLQTFDETNRRVRASRLIRWIRKGGGRALIAMVGVQSNQFARAVDLARPFLAAGLPVCIGGFHVSGTIAMLPEMPPEMHAAQELGISFFAGEAECGRLDEVLLDAWNGRLKPLYNYMDDLPPLEGEPAPYLPAKHVRRTAGELTSIDLGRGCPYQCSFCTIINVQGRKSRYRSPDDLEKIVREYHAQGIKRFFVTDDNFARNRQWEPLFDRMIELRREGLDVGFTLQVDTLCHRIPNFIEKAQQ